MSEKRIGRPRTRPPDLEIFNTQITPRAKARLMALAKVDGTYAYAILEDAFWQVWEALPNDRREAAEVIAQAVEANRRKTCS